MPGDVPCERTATTSLDDDDIYLDRRPKLANVSNHDHKIVYAHMPPQPPKILPEVNQPSGRRATWASAAATPPASTSGR
jgi:hypothetical protein